MDHPELFSAGAVKHEGAQLAAKLESNFILFLAWLLDCKMRAALIAFATAVPFFILGYEIGKHHFR